MANKALEDLINGLSRKFHAKLIRVASEFGETPETVLDEGVELFRWKRNLLRGKHAGSLNEQQLMEHSVRHGIIMKSAFQDLPEDVRKKRAQAGALGRIKSLRKKRIAAKKKD